MDEGSIAIVAEGALDYLREIRRALSAAGIAAEMMQPPPERQSG